MLYNIELFFFPELHPVIKLYISMERWSLNAIVKPNPYQQELLCVQNLLNFLSLNVSGQK